MRYNIDESNNKQNLGTFPFPFLSNNSINKNFGNIEYIILNIFVLFSIIFVINFNEISI